MLKTSTFMTCPETGEPQLVKVHERLLCTEHDQETDLGLDLSDAPFDASNGEEENQYSHRFEAFVAKVTANAVSILRYLGLVRRPAVSTSGRESNIGCYEMRPDG